MLTTASVATGSARKRSASARPAPSSAVPPAGSQPSVTANRMISRMPSQKVGVDCARIAKPSTAGAARGRTAASTPSATPSPAASSSAQPSSTSVEPSAGHSTCCRRHGVEAGKAEFAAQHGGGPGQVALVQRPIEAVGGAQPRDVVGGQRRVGDHARGRPGRPASAPSPARSGRRRRQRDRDLHEAAGDEGEHGGRGGAGATARRSRSAPSSACGPRRPARNGPPARRRLRCRSGVSRRPRAPGPARRPASRAAAATDGARARRRRVRRNGADGRGTIGHAPMRPGAVGADLPAGRVEQRRFRAAEHPGGAGLARLARVDLHAVGHHLEQRGRARGRHHGRRPLLRRGRRPRCDQAPSSAAKRRDPAQAPASAPPPPGGVSRRRRRSSGSSPGWRRASAARPLAPRLLHRRARRHHHQAHLVGDGDELEAHVDHAVRVGAVPLCSPAAMPRLEVSAISRS